MFILVQICYMQICMNNMSDWSNGAIVNISILKWVVKILIPLLSIPWLELPAWP